MSEENKKGYDSVDTDALSEKMSETMLFILKGEHDEGRALFDHVGNNFTSDERTYLTAVHIATMIKRMMEENPIVGLMAAMIRQTATISNHQGAEELLKKFKDILNEKK